MNLSARMTARTLWLISIGSFWLSTLIITFIDFAGEKWGSSSWPAGPDLFPNRILGYPLAALQILSACILIAACYRYYSGRRSMKRVFSAAALAVLTIIVNFTVYALLGAWYQYYFIGRTL